MDIEDIMHQIGQAIDQRKALVGDLEDRIQALQTQRDVLAAPIDAQLTVLKTALTEHLTQAGADKTTLKTRQFTYSFFFKEDIDRAQLKAMALELPQLQQCFVTTPAARLLVR